jgi:isoaspartyl peptidase/L-asparaginase-like protein (Ntn-hydrolase superfamily)
MTLTKLCSEVINNTFRFAKPISVARCVLDSPSLSMVVGGGATQYAEQRGFTLEENDKLLTQQTASAYQVCAEHGCSDVDQN